MSLLSMFAKGEVIQEVKRDFLPIDSFGSEGGFDYVILKDKSAAVFFKAVPRDLSHEDKPVVSRVLKTYVGMLNITPPRFEMAIVPRAADLGALLDTYRDQLKITSDGPTRKRLEYYIMHAQKTFIEEGHAAEADLIYILATKSYASENQTRELLIQAKIFRDACVAEGINITYMRESERQALFSRHVMPIQMTRFPDGGHEVNLMPVIDEGKSDEDE